MLNENANRDICAPMRKKTKCVHFIIALALKYDLSWPRNLTEMRT